ncbi:MAG: DNA internalization-related competence protein ComEC/Rec2 [Wenzhouxiangellaceae bacterium]|nr:DNA internalization-related competence protein ComEC/Rec2 [Wenzhouxiangellaceae bacterium]
MISGSEAFAPGATGRAAALFCFGVLVAAALPVLPSWPALAILFLLSLVLLWRLPGWRCWAAFPIGMLWFSCHALWFEHRAWPAERVGETVELVGRVVGLPQQQGGRARIEIRSDRSARQAGVPARILLSWYRPLDWFRPGEDWRLRVTLEPPRGRLNPGLFDYQQYLVARGIGATGRIVAAERVGPGSWTAAPDRLRQRFSDWLQAESVDLEVAALHRALTVGDRSAMEADLNDRLRRTGTAHLLSISGLHVGMVATLVGLLAGVFATTALFGRLLPERKRAMLVAGLLAALGYAALAGFSLPTQRALIMLLAGFGAILWRRPIRPGHALVLALLAVLLFDPLAPLSIGFWLSFAAVAVLIWSFAWRADAGGWVVGLLRAQWVLAIGLLPLNIGIFHQWAPAALLANLLAIPLVGFWVLPLLLLALVLFAAGLPAEAVLAASEQGLRLLLTGLGWLAELDARFAGWSLPNRASPGLLAIILAAAGAAWLLAPRGWPARPLGAVLVLPLLFPPASELGNGEFDVLVPDLGDGQAVIVRTKNHTLLFNTGPGDGARANLVDSTIAPLLRQSGAAGVDTIVVSHRNRDYSGGLAGARALWPDANLFASFDGPGQRCAPGRSWRADGVEFLFLHPSPRLPDLGGDSSCVLEVRSAAGSLLMTGGIGATVTRRLLANGRAAPVDAVVLPGSGHRDGFDADWLAAIDPRWALIPVAAFNRRGLPHAEAIERVEKTGAAVLTSADCGALRLSFRQQVPALLEAQVIKNRRFWRASEACRQRLALDRVPAPTPRGS